MPEPALYFINQLQSELQKNNLSNSDTKLILSESSNSYNIKPEQLVYTHTSPKLEKIVYYTNIKSNNHYAESLLNTIGAVKSGKKEQQAMVLMQLKIIGKTEELTSVVCIWLMEVVYHEQIQSLQKHKPLFFQKYIEIV